MKNLHRAETIYTGGARGARDKYQVWSKIVPEILSLLQYIGEQSFSKPDHQFKPTAVLFPIFNKLISAFEGSFLS